MRICDEDGKVSAAPSRKLHAAFEEAVEDNASAGVLHGDKGKVETSRYVLDKKVLAGHITKNAGDNFATTLVINLTL